MELENVMVMIQLLLLTLTDMFIVIVAISERVGFNILSLLLSSTVHLCGLVFTCRCLRIRKINLLMFFY